MRRIMMRGLLVSILVLLSLSGCTTLKVEPTQPSTATMTPTSTPDPCTGWWCTITGVIYAETTDFSNQFEGVTVTLHQTSYCSPTSGQQQTITGSDGSFEFSDVFFHDTDRIRIQFESKEFELAQWDSTDYNCLYCSCFESPLEIILHTTPDP